MLQVASEGRDDRTRQAGAAAGDHAMSEAAKGRRKAPRSISLPLPTVLALVVLAVLFVSVSATTALAEPSAARAAKLRGHDVRVADGIVVEVTWSRKLARRQAQIDRIERIMEERWRRYRSVGRNRHGGILDNAARRRGRDIRHAGVRLVPRLEDYTMVALLKAATAYNLRRAVPDFRGRIVYRVKTLKVANHPIAFLGGGRSYAIGRVKVIGADGATIVDHKVSISLNEDIRIVAPDEGRGLIFFETEANRRVAPLLVRFVERSLELAWPDRREEIVGPVFIRVAGPGQRIVPP